MELVMSIEHCATKNPDDYDCTECDYKTRCFYDKCDELEELVGCAPLKAPKLAKALLPMMALEVE